jgi:BRCT domain type II-containing protein
MTGKTVDIIIGDPSCPIELVKRAKQMKIPVISNEYIVQCLINGRKLSYDASPLFSYTYKNTSNL